MRLLAPHRLAIVLALIRHTLVVEAVGDLDDGWRANVPPSPRGNVAATLPAQTAPQASSVLRASSSSLTSLATESSDVAFQSMARELDPRQTQEVVNVASDCIQPTKAWIPQVYCASYSDLTSAAEMCRTLWSSTTACNVDTAASTVSAPGAVMEVECIKGMCGGGACSATSPEIGAECTGCITSSGSVFVAQATAFPSGTAPPQLTGPLVSFSSIETASAPSSSVVIQKRTMPLIADYASYNEFMVDQCAIAFNAGLIVPFRSDEDGTSSALVRHFREEPFTMAIENLVGCTCVIVISRRGVYWAHFWEDPSFYPGDNFDQDVLLGIWNGDNSGLFPGLGQFESMWYGPDASGNRDHNIKVFIVAPQVIDEPWSPPDNAPPAVEYLKYMPQILQLISNIEGLGIATVIPYRLQDAPADLSPLQRQQWREEQARTTYHGRIVLQYDPLEYLRQEPVKDPNTGEVIGNCDKPYAQWKLLVDDKRLVGMDSWPASEEQLRGSNVYNEGEGQQRRDGEQKIVDWSQPICVPVNSTSTTTSAIPATPTCTLHLVEEILDSIKNDSQTGQIQAQYNIFDWQGSSQNRDGWLPRHNMTDNYTVTGLGNTRETILIANFAEKDGSLVSSTNFDSLRMLEYGIAVQVNTTEAGLISWNIEEDMDNSLMPNCSIGGWTSQDLTEKPVRNLDCWYPCNGILPNRTAGRTSSSTSTSRYITHFSFQPTTTAPTSTTTLPVEPSTSTTTPMATCTVHVTQFVWSVDEPDGELAAKITFTDGTGHEDATMSYYPTISEFLGGKGWYGFNTVFNLTGLNNVMIASVQFKREYIPDSEIASRWYDLAAKVTLYLPTGKSTVYTSQTDSSYLAYCNVGSFTHNEIKQHPIRDMDCYFLCEWGWAAGAS